MTEQTEEDIMVALQKAPHAQDVLAQLFLSGPTWDGNLISKSGRSYLSDIDLIDRHDGWQWLNFQGVQAALKFDFSNWRDPRAHRKQNCM